MSKSDKKITKYSFEIPIFNQKFKIIIGNNKNVKSWFEQRDIVLEDFDSADAACFGIDNLIYIWFEPNPTISVISHESAHAVFALMRSRGLDIKDEEVFCYLLEFIIDSILKCLKIISPTVTDHINQK
jgi:hypothetical protein